jgi:hypothetical protein
MRFVTATGIALLWVSSVHAEPTLIGQWTSDRDSSASFNEHHAQLEPKTASFLRQSMGRLTVTFTAETVASRLPDFETTIEGEKHKIVGFSEVHPYQVLGSTEDTVAIQTTEPVSGRKVILLYTFEGPNKMWVYVSSLGSHLREYFVRKIEG